MTSYLLNPLSLVCTQHTIYMGQLTHQVQLAARVLSSVSREISCMRYYHCFEYYDGPELPSDSSDWLAPDPDLSRSPSPATEPPVGFLPIPPDKFPLISQIDHG